MKNQLNRGLKRRLMYVENKDGVIDGVVARIGWVEFSRSGKTVYYRGRELVSIGGRGVRGNFMDGATREEYWVSGVKLRGSNAHWAEKVIPEIDPDALEEYRAMRSGVAVRSLKGSLEPPSRPVSLKKMNEAIALGASDLERFPPAFEPRRPTS
jgi:hypothetical protein